ncbi:MAG: OmpA family protein [Paludibacteraceae bacterium]|nr:OmpA family protein [Paludibacteraceae bacterium]
MASKIRVHAKSLKWAALGIIDAYVKMYPHATLEDLNKAFPNRELGFGTDRDLLMSQEGLEKFVESTESTKDDEMLANWKETGYFVTMADGTKISFKPLYIWTKEKFQKLESMAKLYDVEVASFEEWQAGKKGSYSLEYLNGYVPPVPEKKNNKWLWILLAAMAVLALIVFFLLGKSCSNEKVVVTERVVTVTDTITVIKVEKEIEVIEKNFNAAKFEQGAVDLMDDAKFVLHDLQKLMDKEENANVRLKVVGHTSAEGNAEFNQKLSEDRAKAVVDFLVSQGVSADRLEYEGKGSSEPLDANNLEVNRRTQIIVINK